MVDMDDIKRKTTCCLYITTVSALRWNRDGVRVKQRDRQPIQSSPQLSGYNSARLGSLGFLNSLIEAKGNLKAILATLSSTQPERDEPSRKKCHCVPAPCSFKRKMRS